MPSNKKTTNKEPQKPPLILEEEIHIGNFIMSETQAISLSLIRSKGSRYISIKRVYKTKNDDSYKPKSGMWLPFQEADKIIHLLQLSYDTGLRMGWDKPPFVPAPINVKSDSLSRIPSGCVED